MRFVPQVTGLASALGMAVLLSGCATYDNVTSSIGAGASAAFEGVVNLGEGVAPWGGTRPASPGDSLTVQRVRGGPASGEPLLPEPGNVWPEPEAPRATLMNPDQALRGISNYPTPGALSEPAPRRGAGGPQVPAPGEAAPVVPAPQSALPPLAPLPPAAQRGGQVVRTPQGDITPATGGATAPFNSPSGGGTVTRDGNTSVINRPGEPPQIIQNPR